VLTISRANKPPVKIRIPAFGHQVGALSLQQLEYSGTCLSRVHIPIYLWQLVALPSDHLFDNWQLFPSHDTVFDNFLDFRFTKGNGYLTESGLLVLNAIHPVRLFARLIGDSEQIPDAALTLTKKRYNFSFNKKNSDSIKL